MVAGTSPSEDTRTGGVARVLLASTIGSVIEWYDFYLYSTASALVLGPLFFPGSSPTAATLASFATYAAGFVARPLGGLLVGHLGDRTGRKSMLVLTLLIMGVSTFLVGCLPTYHQAGIIAPIALVCLRILQGIGIGGEWGGGVLMAIENAPPGKRGWYSSWPLVSFPLGLLASTLTFTAVAQLPEDDLLSWGWRIPFLLSIVLVGVGVYVRVGLTETPEFTAVRADRGLARVPLWEVVRTRPKQAVGGALAALGIGSVVSMYTIYLLSTASGGAARSTALTGMMVGAACQCVTVPLYATLSDRYGRKPVMIWGYLVTAGTVFPALSWVGSGNVALASLAFVLAMAVGHAGPYGNLAAFLSGMFTIRSRYTALAVTYQLGATISSFLPLAATAVVGGGPDRLPAAWLYVAVIAVAAVAVAWVPAGPPAQPDVDARREAESVAS